jgi:hypothetical protein
MKTTTLCLLVSLSLAALVVTILWPRPKQETKEPFATDVKEVGIGIAIGIGIVVVIFASFFFYFYSVPKEPNVLPRYRNLN